MAVLHPPTPSVQEMKDKSNNKIADRAEGALIGSALGDSIGIYTEFLTAEQSWKAYPDARFSLIDPTTPFYQDSHRCRFETVCFSHTHMPLAIPEVFTQRAWTDDTDHTILMILSYLSNGKLDHSDFATRLQKWCTQGLRVLDRLPMGLGRTVGTVVFSEDYLKNPSEAARAVWEKGKRDVAPNGSVMRTTPVGVVCINATEEDTFSEAIKMGAVTHADPRCAVSVAITSGLVRALCLDLIKDNADVDALMERAFTHVNKLFPEYPLDRAEFDRHMYAVRLEELVLCDRTMGYVYKCLGSAIWCLRQVLNRQETFRSAMVKLIMMGGDSDTNGSVAGALMGALYGYELLPVEWRDGMRHLEWYRRKISEILIVSSIKTGTYVSETDTDTLPDGGKGWISEDEMKRREMEIMEKILLANQSLRHKADVERTKNDSNKWRFWTK